MRTAVTALLLIAIALPGGVSARVHSEEPTVVAEPRDEGAAAPTWGQDQPSPSGGAFGFAPITVTQGGVAYSPAAPAFDPAAPDQTKLADLPAWASTYSMRDEDAGDALLARLGLGREGSLPEPIAWVLVLMGVALIAGALRGLIRANRRLARLRAREDAPEA